MFDPCITHQNLFNEIKGLEAILNPFSFLKFTWCNTRCKNEAGFYLVKSFSSLC
jgi:hypothetical protein